MHELALADAVITTALETADREKLSTISRIAVRVGELQQIRREVFRFALAEVMPRSEPRLAGTSITLDVEPARLDCRACSRGFGLADGGPADPDQAEAIHLVPELCHAFLRCPRCGSPDFAVRQGRGVVIDFIEGD